MDVVRAVAETLRDLNFAIGGGQALRAHGVTDRATHDVDAYVTDFSKTIFDQAQEKLITECASRGWTAVVEYADSWLRQLRVTASSGQEVLVDLGQDYRRRPPVAISGVSSVLALDDVAMGKTRALAERGAARDYLDVVALLRKPGWNSERLFAAFQEALPLENRNTFANLLRHADTAPAADYQAYGIGPRALVELGVDLAAVADAIEAGTPMRITSKQGPASAGLRRRGAPIPPPSTSHEHGPSL